MIFIHLYLKVIIETAIYGEG